MNTVKGYKVFNPDWTCSPNGNTKQYSCPGKFEEDITSVRCGHGMHFCRKASDCFDYYDFNSKNKVAEVIAYGDIAEEGDKCCTNKLEIVREIPWQELLTIVNTGKDCTGLGNSGDCNSGNKNSGDCNSGDGNSGDGNSGNGNSGDWNDTDFSSGCFNTKEQKILLFDKPSDWTYLDWLESEARNLLNDIPKGVVEWIWSVNMTDEEKKANPTYETTGGYLKVLDAFESAQLWWDGLTPSDKERIKSLPNFDAYIFEKCTGIKVTNR